MRSNHRPVMRSRAVIFASSIFIMINFLPFATVRHRTIRSKGCLSNKTALAMVFKLAEGAQKSWRRIDGHNQLPKLIQGVKFADGIEVIGNSAVPQAQAAA